MYTEEDKIRFEHKSKIKQNYDIEIELKDISDEYEGIVYSGIEIDIMLINRKYVDTIFPLLTIENDEINYRKNLVLVEECEIGIDSARIGYGVNGKAKILNGSVYNSHTIDDLLNEYEPMYALMTGSDGYYGKAVLFKTVEDIPILLKTDGYITSDMKYTHEELKDYFIKQFEIKDVEIDYDKKMSL